MKGRSSEIEQPFEVAVHAATGESGHSGANQDDDQNDEERKVSSNEKLNDLDNLNFNGITSARKPKKENDIDDVFEQVSNNSVIFNGDEEDGEFGKLEDNSVIFD